MKLIYILFTATIIALTLFECSPTSITIQENTQIENYSIQKGDTVEVILSANPSTFFKWHIVNIDTSKLQIIDESYTAKQVKRDIVGSGGNKTYRFKAISKGSLTIEINYFRPFEKELPPLKKFNISLEID